MLLQIRKHFVALCNTGCIVNVARAILSFVNFVKLFFSAEHNQDQTKLHRGLNADGAELGILSSISCQILRFRSNHYSFSLCFEQYNYKDKSQEGSYPFLYFFEIVGLLFRYHHFDLTNTGWKAKLFFSQVCYRLQEGTAWIKADN